MAATGEKNTLITFDTVVAPIMLVQSTPQTYISIYFSVLVVLKV